MHLSADAAGDADAGVLRLVEELWEIEREQTRDGDARHPDVIYS
jgi:hypothetical protein